MKGGLKFMITRLEGFDIEVWMKEFKNIVVIESIKAYEEFIDLKSNKQIKLSHIKYAYEITPELRQDYDLDNKMNFKKALTELDISIFISFLNKTSISSIIIKNNLEELKEQLRSLLCKDCYTIFIRRPFTYIYSTEGKRSMIVTRKSYYEGRIKLYPSNIS